MDFTLLNLIFFFQYKLFWSSVSEYTYCTVEKHYDHYHEIRIRAPIYVVVLGFTLLSSNSLIEIKGLNNIFYVNAVVKTWFFLPTQ